MLKVELISELNMNNLVNRVFSRVINGLGITERYQGSRKKRINRILNESEVPSVERSEEVFDLLQSQYPSTREVGYQYDSISLFRRASNRALDLLALEGVAETTKQILDVGAGDAVLGVLLNAFGHDVTLADQEDWRAPMAIDIPWVKTDVCEKLPFDNETFDLVVSYNSFEHFPRPDKALRECVRVLKPGGKVYINFNPLYCSPWGLHAYRSLYMPYSQFLFSKDFILKKLLDLGIQDLGKKRAKLQFVNQWTSEAFNNLWVNSGCEVEVNEWHEDCGYLDLVLKYPESFRGRGLKYQDLVRSGNVVVLCKR
jgi:ubiquinone/menaquinone biosynthesis C-methylase UbiE